MKKLVLFVAIVAAVALSACEKKAPAAVEETQIEAPAEVVPTEEATAPEEAIAPEEAPASAEEAPAPAE